MKDDIKIIILGAGIAGMSAAYYLNKNGLEPVVLEKESSYGGLCNSFTVDGFTFDTFAHISFDNEPGTYDILEGQTEHYTHSSEALNYCDGNWVRNPVQNNLIGLPVEERIQIIKDYIDRNTISEVNSYSEWLDSHFGHYFARRYPYRYTRKYWTVPPGYLEPRWIEGRMNTLDIDALLRSAMEKNETINHYSKEARYPKKGGFREFLKPLAETAKIIYSSHIRSIDIKKKQIDFIDGKKLDYDEIISTIPLPELICYISNVADYTKSVSQQLDYTSGAMISLGFNRTKTSPSLWFYIYDEDIYPARVYSPDWKSPNNVPDGCSAMQAEVYFSKYKPLNMELDDLKESVINQLSKLGLFQRDDIIVSDVRYKEYANVMFTHPIYEARETIHKYLDEIGVYYAGRWGEWDYLWTGQSYRSGRDAAKRLIERVRK